MKLLRFAALVAALGICGTNASASAAPASPATAHLTAEPCASNLPDLPNNFPTAFAYDLISVPILRFIARLASVPEKQQKQLFTTVTRAARSPQQLAVSTALGAHCPNLDEVYGQTRALTLVSNLWTLNDTQDGTSFDAFARVVGNEIDALSLGDVLSPDTTAAAAEPFASLDSMPVPTPTPTPTPVATASADGTCPPTDPRVVHDIELEYPEYAGAAGLTGQVNVRVTLNASGDVESARVFSDTLKSQTGSEEVIRHAIFSAAASTYAPGTVHCKAVGGAFLFGAVFEFDR